MAVAEHKIEGVLMSGVQFEEYNRRVEAGEHEGALLANAVVADNGGPPTQDSQTVVYDHGFWRGATTDRVIHGSLMAKEGVVEYNKLVAAGETGGHLLASQVCQQYKPTQPTRKTRSNNRGARADVAAASLRATTRASSKAALAAAASKGTAASAAPASSVSKGAAATAGAPTAASPVAAVTAAASPPSLAPAPVSVSQPLSFKVQQVPKPFEVVPRAGLAPPPAQTAVPVRLPIHTDPNSVHLPAYHAKTAVPIPPGRSIEHKCNVRPCVKQGQGLPFFPCKNPECKKVAHYPCFEAKFDNKPYPKLLPGDVCCTITCYKALKDPDRKCTGWNNDGANGYEDTNCSMNLLIDWMTTGDNYAKKWRGKDSGGLKKGKVAEKIAAYINSFKVTSKRTGGMVKNKIQYLEGQFREAHLWATGTTGAGLEETDRGDWESSVNNKCPYYFDLEPIMGDRASTKPPMTSDQLGDDDSDDDDDDDDDDEDSQEGTEHVGEEDTKMPAKDQIDDASDDTDALIDAINNPDKYHQRMPPEDEVAASVTAGADPVAPAAATPKVSREEPKTATSVKKNKRKGTPKQGESVPVVKRQRGSIVLGDPGLNAAQERLFAAKAKCAETKSYLLLQEKKEKDQSMQMSSGIARAKHMDQMLQQLKDYKMKYSWMDKETFEETFPDLSPVMKFWDKFE